MGDRGHVRAQVGARDVDDRDALLALFDADEPIVWPWPNRPPAHAAARRLLEALGVVGMPDNGREGPDLTVSVQAMTETLDCVTPLCVDAALPGLQHCRRHAPVAQLAAQRANGYQAQPEPRPLGARWTDEDILDAIRHWATEHGQPPTANHWRNRHNGYPSLSVVTGHFGSWATAIERAGFPRPVRGLHRQGQAPKAPEKLTPSPVVRQAASTAAAAVGEESPEPVAAELGARPDEPGAALEVVQETGLDHSGSIPEPPGTTNGAAFSLHLALTGDFTRDAQNVRAEALKLRAQAEALDVIAVGIDKLQETIA